MAVSIDITDTQVFTALRSFLLGIFPSGVEIVQGLDNQVSMPAPPCIIMTPLFKQRLAANTATYTDSGAEHPLDGTKNSLMPTQYTIQVDFYGELSGDQAETVATVFRDDYAVAAFPEAIKPLYCSDPKRLDFTNDQAQYEKRWEIDVEIQYNPTTKTPMQFADDLDVTDFSVETITD